MHSENEANAALLVNLKSTSVLNDPLLIREATWAIVLYEGDEEKPSF